MINIRFTTKSPLCQIDKTEDASKVKNSTMRVKKQKIFVENSHGAKKALQVPIYTGNGFRGMLRRDTMAVMLDARAKTIEDNEKFIPTPEDYHLMNAGGGSMYSEQPFDIEDNVRILNPHISLFGASLAIEGKLKVSNFVPCEEDENGEIYYQYFETENGNVYSSILDEATLVIKDGLLDRDKNSQFMSKEQMQEWYEKCDTNIKQRSAKRDNIEPSKKVRKQSMRGIINKEYVASGVDFFGGISEKKRLTNIEKGLLIKGLEKTILNNLGSTSTNDFGKVEYIIGIDEKSFIETTIDKYGKCIISKRIYSEELQNCIMETEDFLCNITIENFEISKILKNNS